MVKPREIGQHLIASLFEPGNVFARPCCPLSGIYHEMVSDQRIGELFSKDRGNSDGEMKWNALVSKIVESVQQWDIRFGDCFMHPLFPVWPCSGLAGVREMAMQDKCERTRFLHE
jgi:hypothetical protein